MKNHNLSEYLIELNKTRQFREIKPDKKLSRLFLPLAVSPFEWFTLIIGVLFAVFGPCFIARLFSF